MSQPAREAPAPGTASGAQVESGPLSLSAPARPPAPPPFYCRASHAMAFAMLLFALLFVVGASAEWDQNPWQASAALAFGAVFAGLSLWMIRSPKAFIRVDADGIRIGQLRGVLLVRWKDVVRIRSGRMGDANVLIIDRAAGSEPVVLADLYRKPLPQILQALQRWQRSVEALDTHAPP